MLQNHHPHAAGAANPQQPDEDSPLNRTPLQAGRGGGERAGVYLANTLVLSGAFFGIFAAFNTVQVRAARATRGAPSLGVAHVHVCSAQSFQTSLGDSKDAPPGLASWSLSALYITFTLAAIPTPKLVSYLGPRCARARFPARCCC